MSTRRFLYSSLLIPIAIGTSSSFVLAQQDSGFTNKAEAKNQMVNGLKEGKWCEYRDSLYSTMDTNKATDYSLIVYKNGNPFGIERYYYMNGVLKSYIDRKKNGVVKYYYRSGKLKGEYPVVDEGEKGVEKGYYESGKLKSECPTIYYIKNDVEKMYYESGALMSEIPYCKNSIDGIKKVYYENGRLKTETAYKDGVPGSTKNYDENGNEIK